MRLSDNGRAGWVLAITCLGLLLFFATGHELLGFAVFLTVPIMTLVSWLIGVVVHGDHPFILGRKNRRQGARMIDNPYRQPYSRGGPFSAVWWDLGWRSAFQKSGT